MDAKYMNELKSGYTDKNGVAKLCFIDGFPQQLASEFNKAQPSLSVKQSRGIFDAINSLYGSYARKAISFDEAKIELSLLKSRINDKVNKESISKEFFDFFTTNIENIKNTNDFKIFKLHFEAICNYLKDEKPRQSGNNSSHNNEYNGQNNRNNYNRYQNRQNFKR